MEHTRSVQGAQGTAVSSPHICQYHCVTLQQNCSKEVFSSQVYIADSVGSTAFWQIRGISTIKRTKQLPDGALTGKDSSTWGLNSQKTPGSLVGMSGTYEWDHIRAADGRASSPRRINRLQAQPGPSQKSPRTLTMQGLPWYTSINWVKCAQLVGKASERRQNE